MTSRTVSLGAAVLLTVAAVAYLGHMATGPYFAFRVRFEPGAQGEPVTGRMFVIASPISGSEPRFQVDVEEGAPFWGQDVNGVRPGQPIVLGRDQSLYGYPYASLEELPAGDYYVQAFLNVYTTFHRADGSVVQLHMPCGDGQYLWDSPGNLYSDVRRIQLGPDAGTIDLALTNTIEPTDPVPPGGTCRQGNPLDTKHVRHVKIQSELLSAFWGTKMYLGANILLPDGYNHRSNSGRRYPVVYLHGHFPFENPFRFQESLSNSFSRWWVSERAPEVIVVELRHENPYFDDSYAVNSANLGPYGDAITEELMPEIDRRFRTIDEPWARSLTGESTGGWEALAQQVFYPDLYGGVWSLCPDPVDFHALQLVDIYADANAYLEGDGGRQARPSARGASGETLYTMAEENHYELALGTHGRSGLGQWDIWQAVYGPQGSDGYPAPVWNKITGVIDHSVAQAWEPMEIRAYLETNWSTLGASLKDRIHVYIGDADTYFLNRAVHELQRSAATLHHPKSGAEFQYGADQPHCWSPYSNQELVALMSAGMRRD